MYFRFGLDILQHGGSGGNVLDIGLKANMGKGSKRVKFAMFPAFGESDFESECDSESECESCSVDTKVVQIGWIDAEDVSQFWSDVDV